jgi:hypothetical protein
MNLKCIFGNHDWETLRQENVRVILDKSGKLTNLDFILYVDGVREILKREGIRYDSYVTDKVCLNCGKKVDTYTRLQRMLPTLILRAEAWCSDDKAKENLRRKRAKELFNR